LLQFGNNLWQKLTMDKPLHVYSELILHNWGEDCKKLDTNPTAEKRHMTEVLAPLQGPTLTESPMLLI